jgi:hypothetical protein
MPTTVTSSCPTEIRWRRGNEAQVSSNTPRAGNPLSQWSLIQCLAACAMCRSVIPCINIAPGPCTSPARSLQRRIFAKAANLSICRLQGLSGKELLLELRIMHTSSSKLGTGWPPYRGCMHVVRIPLGVKLSTINFVIARSLVQKKRAIFPEWWNTLCEATIFHWHLFCFISIHIHALLNQELHVLRGHFRFSTGKPGRKRVKGG